MRAPVSDKPALPRKRKGPLWAGVWMTLACVCFTSMSIFVRLLAESQSSYQITFYRALIGALFIAPIALRPMLIGRTGPKPGGSLNWFGYLKRVFFLYLGMLTYFVAIGAMHLADAVALNSSIPLFTVLFAGIFLAEAMTVQRWGAVIAGFAGVLIVVRPGFAEFGWPAVLAVSSAAFYALSYVELKILARTEPANRIIFYQNIAMTPVALAPALFFWLPPAWADVPWMLGVGVAGALAHMCSTRAYAAADISVAAVFDSLRLPMAAVMGAILFNDRLEIWVAVGGLIIVGSSVYLALHEARKKASASKGVGGAVK